MTKKEYMLIAYNLKQALACISHDEMELFGFKRAVYSLVESLSQLNPRFKQVPFYDAIYGKKELT